MSITLTSLPISTVAGESTRVSRWNAAHHPIAYGFQRRDYQVAGISFSGIYMRLITFAGETPAAGDQIYMNQGPYVGTYTVTSVSGTSAVLDGLYINNQSGGGYFNNLTQRPGYHLQAVVYGVNSQNAYTEVGRSRWYSDITGAVNVDVSAYVAAALSLQNTNTHTSVNEAEPGLGGSVNIVWKRVWVGGGDASFTELSNDNRVFCVNAARQFGDQDGANMSEFVPFHDALSPKAQFLGHGGQPVWFAGMPFCLDFIYSDTVANAAITREVQFLDINGTVIGSDSTPLQQSTSVAHRVNHLNLHDLTVPAGTASVNVWLTGDDNLTVEYYQPGYVADGYVESRTTYSPDDPSSPPPVED